MRVYMQSSHACLQNTIKLQEKRPKSPSFLLYLITRSQGKTPYDFLITFWNNQHKLAAEKLRNGRPGHSKARPNYLIDRARANFHNDRSQNRRYRFFDETCNCHRTCQLLTKNAFFFEILWYIDEMLKENQQRAAPIIHTAGTNWYQRMRKQKFGCAFTVKQKLRKKVDAARQIFVTYIHNNNHITIGAIGWSHRGSRCNVRHLSRKICPRATQQSFKKSKKMTGSV